MNNDNVIWLAKKKHLYDGNQQGLFMAWNLRWNVFEFENSSYLAVETLGAVADGRKKRWSLAAYYIETFTKVTL